MVRSIFFSTGLFVLLWGISFLAIDKVVLNMEQSPGRNSGFRGMFSGIGVKQKKEFDPPEWAAFSLMSVGTVTMLYSVALPKKQG